MSRPGWHDMVGAYVLDALDADEMRGFEAQLAGDTELRRLVDEARASTLALAEALPELQAPPRLKESVLARARESRGGEAHVPASTPLGPAGDAREGHRRRPSAVPWILLAASVAGLVWLGMQNSSLRSESTGLAAQLDSVRGSLAGAEVALARLDSLALALTGPDVQFATLTGDVLPNLRLFWNVERAILVVAAENLPPAPSGRTYQLWGIRGSDAPVSLGTFNTDAAGAALLTLSPAAVADFDVAAITEEPAGGSPQPTTQPFLVGGWTAAQD